MIKKLFLLTIVTIFMSHSIYSQQKEINLYGEKQWAIGMAMRNASIPFASEKKSVGSLVPLLYYEGKYFYMRGIEGGFHFFTTEDWAFSAFGRLHFFDFPAEYQNQLQGDNVDWGLRAKYGFASWSYADIEFMSDWNGNVSSNLRLGYKSETNSFRFDSFLEFKWKTKKYNSYYFGLKQEDVNSGIDMSVGVIADYHLASNFYLFGAAKVALLDKNARNVSFVNSDVHGQVFLGIGFSNDRSKPKKKELENKPYIRIGQGFATPSALAQIIRLQSVPDTNHNKMTSIFYGHPLADRFFGLPIHIYLHTGFVYHWPSDVQQNAQEIDVAIKLYYTIPLPIRIRFGAAEGLTYVNRVPYVERKSLEDKGYVPSNLMNYLDFSLDLNIGDIFGNDTLKRLWIGYYIHHRSSIFETAQHFGRISGGSNFNTFYVMWDL